MVCKIGFTTETQKPHLCVRPWALLIILNFSEQGPKDNGILMSLLLLVSETKNNHDKFVVFLLSKIVSVLY